MPGSQFIFVHMPDSLTFAVLFEANNTISFSHQSKQDEQP